jgi:formylglycine-generating enzyme required for sulfatase activity
MADEKVTINIPESLEMVFVKGGEFEMGSVDGGSDEKPVHKVWVDDFYIGKYPVTQGEYERVMGNNPSHFKGDPRLPVDKVTWHDAMEFCKRVGKRLPTEAEWEYSARSGGKRVEYATSTGELSPSLANYGHGVGMTTVVGSYPPNGLGLYDMSGNVWEWCADWYGPYSREDYKNPQGPAIGSHRVLRGGSWLGNPIRLRASIRDSIVPSFPYYTLGFRCVQY